MDCRLGLKPNHMPQETFPSPSAISTHRPGRLLLAVILAAAFVPIVGSQAQAAVSQDSFEQCLLDKANEERSALGRPLLQMAHDRVDAVRDWSRWMRFNDFKHMPSSVRNPILPSSWTTWGENIAMHSWQNMPDCDVIHQMWMNSPGHRANILSPSFRFLAAGAYVDSSGWWATQLFFDASNYTPPCQSPCDDELFFYRDDGLFRYYSVHDNGALSSPISEGSDFATSWDIITAIDLDGNGQDEMLFYRKNGEYAFHSVTRTGSLRELISAGDSFTRNWDSIAGIDLDGDGQDEILFYRSDGLFRYYDVNRDGSIGRPISSGDNYTTGWTSIAGIDLDGDGQDEIFFYRSDGLFRFYNIASSGRIGSPINAGDNYTSGWSSITSVDIEGDGQDEMFFYREDGLYRYYNIRSDGSLGSPLSAGDSYTPGWSAITAVSLD